MKKRSSTGAQVDPLRWTFAGDLDDMVGSYPWAGIRPLSKRALDVRLVFGAIAGTPMLVNDGYLVLNNSCFDSLRDHRSPLRILINQGYVRVLGRNIARSLSQVVSDGADQGIPTYKRLKSDTRKWAATRETLDTVSKDIGEKFWGWPRVNLTSSYLSLIQYLAKTPHEQRGINVPDQTFQDVVKRFEDALSKDASKPRSKWEEIVKGLGQRQFQTLMQLANEVYHHNFGVALAASPPKDLPRGSEIGVTTRVSAVFQEALYKTHAPQLSAPDSVPSSLTLPLGVELFQWRSAHTAVCERATTGKHPGPLSCHTNALFVRNGKSERTRRCNCRISEET